MDLWSKVLQQIDKKISKPSFTTWFGDTTAEIEDDIIVIYAKNEFATDWLEERYKSLIYETVREVAGRTYEIEFSSSESTQESSSIEEYKITNREQCAGSITEQMKSLSNSFKALEKRINRIEKVAEVNQPPTEEKGEIVQTKENQKKLSDAMWKLKSEKIDFAEIRRITQENASKEIYLKEFFQNGEEYEELTTEEKMAIEEALNERKNGDYHTFEDVFGSEESGDNHSIEILEQILSEIQSLRHEISRWEGSMEKQIRNMENRLYAKMEANKNEILMAINSKLR